MKLKFKVGERVRVKKDLVAGVNYYMSDNEKYEQFVEPMNRHRGAEATIMYIVNDKYILDIDNIFKFTDNMLTRIHDELSKKRYEGKKEVEDILEHMLKQIPKIKQKLHKEKIDKALDKGDKDEFFRLTENN